MRTSSLSSIIAMVVIAACAHAAADPAPHTPDRAERVDPGGDGGDGGDDGAVADRPAGRDARTEGVPPISAVLAAAQGAAGLDRDPGRSWVRRTRLAGLVPWLTVRTTRDTSWQDAQSEVGHGTTLEVRATWRLDRLLFDGHELQVATIEAARRRERMRLSSHVIRAYFAWRRAATGQSRASEDRTATTRAEATAELDALTDGWFSEELARRSGSAGQPPRHPTEP